MAEIALIMKAKRALVETAIEQLIAMLDEMDGDCDFEPYHAGFDPRCMDDREGDCERELDHAEYGVADVDALAEVFPGFSYGVAL